MVTEFKKFQEEVMPKLSGRLGRYKRGLPAAGVVRLIGGAVVMAAAPSAMLASYDYWSWCWDYSFAYYWPWGCSSWLSL